MVMGPQTVITDRGLRFFILRASLPHLLQEMTLDLRYSSPTVPFRFDSGAA